MSDRKLHIGGVEPHPDWEILNANDGPHVDHCMDLRDLSEFDDDIYTEIYASHILEHFDYKFELSLILSELYRILIPGGKLYASVPDLDKLCPLFISENTALPERYHIMRMIFGGHIDKYDYHMVGLNEELFKFYLKISGFTNFKIVDNFNLFSDASSLCINGQPISINIISEKPVSKEQEIENSSEIFKSAVEQHQQGHFDIARLVYFSILNKQPDNADVLHLLGVLTSQDGQFEPAIELIQNAITIDPDNAIYLNNLGTVYFQHGKYAEAINASEQALKQQPDFVDAHINLGNALFESGQFKESVEAYQNAVNINPEHSVAYYYLGSTLKELGKIDEAIKAFENTIRLNPHHVESYQILEACLTMLGNVEEANTIKEKLEKIKSENEN